MENPTLVFQYREMGNGFIVNLEYNEQKTSVHVPKDVPKESRIDFTLKLIKAKANSNITISQIADKCNVSGKTIKRDIEKLKAEKRIIRQGGRKDGHWEIR